MGVGLHRGSDTMFDKNDISTQVKHLKVAVHTNRSKISMLVYYVVKTLKEGNNARSQPTQPLEAIY
jgi:hypothetical protein